MNDEHSTYELLLRYLNNDLSSDERTCVEDLLRDDVAARDVLRDLAQQAVVIADVERVSRGTGIERTAEVTSGIRGRSAARQILLVAVAAIAFLAVTVSLLRRGGEPEIVTIRALNGPVEWIGSGGRVTEELAVGKALPGGTIELMSADSWIVFEFHDESTVTLSGQTTATISEQQQKELHLRYGSLSASVRRQPTDRPMLVHTPSADLEVLGTQFNVVALPEATQLAVNEGRVRLKRLSDGKEVDVPARHEVTASISDVNGLSLSERGTAVSVWKSDLKADVVHGKWVPELRALAMQLKKAVADGQMNASDAHSAYKDAATLDDDAGSIWAKPASFGLLIMLSVSRSSSAPVILTTKAKIRIQGRLYSPEGIEFGITVNDPGGGFAGKYSISVEDNVLRGDDNSFEIQLPLSEFCEEPEFDNSLIGRELSDWWCVARPTSAKLEITSVELIE